MVPAEQPDLPVSVPWQLELVLVVLYAVARSCHRGRESSQAHAISLPSLPTLCRGLQGNNHTGELPACWGASLQSLRVLRLGGSPLLSPGFPGPWSQLTALQELEVSPLFLASALPSSWQTVANSSSGVVQAR